MSNPRTSRRGSRPSSVAPAATSRRIGSWRIASRGPRFTRPCGIVRIRSSTWKVFRVTRRRVRPERLPEIHGSSRRPEADSRSTVSAGPGITVPRAESFAAKTGLPFPRKENSPDPPKARIPPSPGVRPNRNPSTARTPWGKATRSRASVSDRSSMSNRRVSGVKSGGPSVSRGRGRS